MSALLADRIRSARRHARLNQLTLAAKIGIDRSAVSHWECGHDFPSSANLLALADILGVRIEWLAHGLGEMTLPKGTDTEILVPIHEDYARDDEEERLLRWYRLLSATARRRLWAHLGALKPKESPAD